jgi:hypothetical protein
MPDRLGAEHWRMRAAEVRLEAKKVSHPTAKKTLASMAKTYDQLTQQAEDIAKSSARSPKA